MSTKLFTEQEIILLQASPYVKSVSMRTVIFISEFKQKLYELLHSGHGAKESIRLPGIGPSILGNTRITGIRQRLEADGKGTASVRTAAENENAALKKRITQLEHDLTYTRQEVEFKKTANGKYGGSHTMGIEAQASVKYELIHNAVTAPNNICSTYQNSVR